MAEPDFTYQFNTQLSPFEEQQFQNWLIQNGKQRDLYNYDLRGAWKAGLAADPRGHLPDTYKKPNHPTFSDESVYNSPQYPGGKWIQNGDAWTFQASPYNVQTYGGAELQKYFTGVEPDSKLVFPQTKPALAPSPAAPSTPALSNTGLFGLGGGLPSALQPDLTGQIPSPPKMKK